MAPSDIYAAAGLSAGTLHVLLALSLACAIAGALLVERKFIARLIA